MDINESQEKTVKFNLSRVVTISKIVHVEETPEEKAHYEFYVREKNVFNKYHVVRFYSTNLMALQEKRAMEISRYEIVNNKVNSGNIKIDFEVKPSLFQLLYTKYKERVN